jgi:hypothetical protein
VNTELPGVMNVDDAIVAALALAVRPRLMHPTIITAATHPRAFPL